MKKLFSLLFLAAVCSMALVSCGSDDDEPAQPVKTNIESAHETESETYFQFDINTESDSSSIYMYNIVFTIGDNVSPAMTIRVDAPLVVDKTGKIFIYSGTGINPYMLMGSRMIQLTDDAYKVNNLNCIVNTKDQTYDISFDCHGGHYEKNGKLK